MEKKRKVFKANWSLLVAWVMFMVLLSVLLLLSGCGEDGKDAASCFVEQLADGTYISCPDSDTFIPDNKPEGGTHEDVIECRRGKGHKKHDHTRHEECSGNNKPKEDYTMLYRFRSNYRGGWDQQAVHPLY